MNSPWTFRVPHAISAGLLIVPGLAWAQAAVSRGQMHILWAFALALCAALAWTLAKWIAKLAEVGNNRYFWGVATAFFVTFAIFIAPFIVVFGSILVSGRAT